MAKVIGIREVGYLAVREHAQSDGLQPVAWHDCAGGGQVVVERDIAYAGNMRNPHGTLIIDVKDPRHPKQLAEISMPIGTHSRKVRVHDGIMIANREILGAHAAHGEARPLAITVTWASTTYRIPPNPGGSPTGRRPTSPALSPRAAWIASTSTAATYIFRRRWTVKAATS